MKVKSVQPTPNPNAFKFVLDRDILPGDTRNYADAGQARGDRLGEALFGVDGVETIFYCDNFVTVSMAAAADWRAVHDRVVVVLESFPESDLPGPEPAPEKAEVAEPTCDDEELFRRINDLLDDRVRPALAGDGGGLEVLGLQNKRLSIRYQGACGSCPSAIAGTLYAIQNLIQTEIDEEIEVVPA